MNIKIQGLPQLGKIFIANTIRNIDIRLFPNSTCYSSCAPIGGAASLINCKIHHKLFNIPVEKEFTNQPVEWTEINACDIPTKFKYWSRIFTLLMDEDSMIGIPFWGLLSILLIFLRLLSSFPSSKISNSSLKLTF